MTAHLKYASYVARHKWFVFVECLKVGLIRRGILHDWHKMLPSEWFPYANHFYGQGANIKTGRDETGYYKPTDTGNKAFDFAWLLHQKRADHHWQWWVLPEDGGGVKILPMSDSARHEMICDWIGASRAQGGCPSCLKGEPERIMIDEDGCSVSRKPEKVFADQNTEPLVVSPSQLVSDETYETIPGEVLHILNDGQCTHEWDTGAQPYCLLCGVPKPGRVSTALLASAELEKLRLANATTQLKGAVELRTALLASAQREKLRLANATTQLKGAVELLLDVIDNPDNDISLAPDEAKRVHTAREICSKALLPQEPE